MKKKQSSRNGYGFSLTELLVVIVIIVVLAGLTIASLPGIQSRVNRAKVEAFLEEIQAGLSRYQIEYGNYPINEPSGSSPQAREDSGYLGSRILYRELSGDIDEDGDVDDDDDKAGGGIEYVQKLAGKLNASAAEKRAIENPEGSGGYLIVDSYNSPIRYLAEKPNKKDKLTLNPTYDIWSIVDTDPRRPDEPKNQAKYITNWTRN